MSKFCSLFSGSKANCTYIESSNGGIVIDMGASYKITTQAFESIGADMSNIKALLVTHTHSDHIKGIKTFLKNYSVPVIASKEVLNILADTSVVNADTKLIPLGEESTEFSGFQITRFSTSHDSPGSGGYTVNTPDGIKSAVCTDLGCVTNSVREALTGSKVLLFESNHDIKMLQNGPYAPQLKLRIASNTGHLSNNASACELPGFVQSGTTHIILGHLSQNNNLPSLARKAAEASLMDIGAKNGEDYTLFAASPSGNKVVYF